MKFRYKILACIAAFVLIFGGFFVNVKPAEYPKDIYSGITDASYDPQSESNRMYVNGVQKTLVTGYFSSANSASGSLTFYITSDGTSGGTAVCTTVFPSSISIWPQGSSSMIFQIGTPTVSGDKKTITAGVNQVNSVLLGLLNFVTVSNGITFNMHMYCE